MHLCSAWAMWWERYALVQSKVRVSGRVSVLCECAEEWVCFICTFWTSWTLKVKLIRSESPCWARGYGREKWSVIISKFDWWRRFVLQLPADETKLKMMQEVSENFEVSLMNALGVWRRRFIFFVCADGLWWILRSFIVRVPRSVTL